MSENEKRCGTCKHWSLTRVIASGELGDCSAPIPISMDQYDRLPTFSVNGNRCPTFERKEPTA